MTSWSATSIVVPVPSGKDVDFHTKQIYVTRSFVQNVVGFCKTESSQKPVPAHHDMVEALREWHGQTPYQSSESWVFASPANQGRWPYLAQQVMRHHILPVARRSEEHTSELQSQ